MAIGRDQRAAQSKQLAETLWIHCATGHLTQSSALERAHVVLVERIVQHATATDVLTAVGTVGATCLALAGIYRTWWVRPRLSMTMEFSTPPNADLQEGAHRPENVDSEDVEPPALMPSGWIRARVLSKRGTAIAAEVVLLRAVLTAQGVTTHVHVEGMSLRWSGRQAVTQLPIPPGLPRHIDVAFVVQSNLEPATPLVLHTAFKPNTKRNEVAYGRLALDLACASANGPPSYYRLIIDYDGRWPEGERIWQHLTVVGLTKLRRHQIRA